MPILETTSSGAEIVQTVYVVPPASASVTLEPLQPTIAASNDERIHNDDKETIKGGVKLEVAPEIMTQLNATQSGIEELNDDAPKQQQKPGIDLPRPDSESVPQQDHDPSPSGIKKVNEEKITDEAHVPVINEAEKPVEEDHHHPHPPHLAKTGVDVKTSSVAEPQQPPQQLNAGGSIEKPPVKDTTTKVRKKPIVTLVEESKKPSELGVLFFGAAYLNESLIFTQVILTVTIQI